MYQFPEDLKRAYESSALSFVYYQNIDGQAVPVLVSDGFCRNTGMSHEEALAWLGVGMFQRMHPDDVGVVSQISDDFLHQRGPYDIVFRCRIDLINNDPDAPVTAAQYEQFHGLGKWQTMPDGTELAVITYTNLSRTREATKEKMQAYKMFQQDRFYTDPLTGLPNLNYLHEFGREKLDAIRADGRTPYLIFTDMCSMQSYNNQYGFKEGDALLRLTAEALKAKFPKALVARGADDHLLIVTGLNDLEEMERRLNEADTAIRKSAKGNTSGIRAGVCPVVEEKELEEAIDHAKHALKQSKNDLTRKVSFFSQEADNAYWRNRYIVENIDRALEKGWVQVFYHALIRVSTGKVAAFEGLARWIDPARGMISPGEFIPVLLKYHQLYKLDLYMFDRVCREVLVRRENGLPLLPVSVNFSRQDFDHADILGEMNRIYEKHGLSRVVDKSYFIVEITEQDLAEDRDRLMEQLRLIRENGYQLWLDDFGSGYSAINMFSQYEFDLIKYDMDLLRHLNDHGGVNRLILKELVYVAQKIGLQTLAEGLETEEQWDFVKEIGCDLAQGFYFHKPESLDEILFRLQCGQSVHQCETPEEREKLNARHYYRES